MRPTLISLAVAMWATATDAGQPPAPRDGKEKDYYAKIEVKGDLYVAPDYKFDPDILVGTPGRLGAVVNGGSLTLNWELIIRDKKHFDFVKANGGKKVIASGEVVIIPPDHPPRGLPTQALRYIIQVTDIRLAGPK